MKKMFVVFATLVLACTINSNAQNFKKDNVRDYVERYRGLAMSEQQRTGIPAAIKLAQGIHETGAGTSKLATQANNHFGLKCKSDWTGQTFAHTDDRRNECFRKYNLDFESYQDHSNYLRGNPRYAELFQLSVTDYAGWAFGLRKAGYATNPQYAQMLIKIIEDYRLQEYTYAAMGGAGATNNVAANTNNNYNNRQEGYNQSQNIQQPPANSYTAQNTYGGQYTQPNSPAAQQPPAQPERVSKYIDTRPRDRQTVVRSKQNGRDVETVVDNTPQNVVKINNLRAVYGKAGDMPLQYAVRHGIRYEKFLEMNDLEEKPLPTDMPLYLERKHFWGIRPMHLVKPGETMLVIAQKEGIQLKYLRDLNYMDESEEPMPGVTLELQAQAAAKPAVRPHTPEDDGRFAQNNYSSNNYGNGNESYDGYGEDPEVVSNPRYYDPSAAQDAPPTRTFPKNPAPVHQEEKNIFEKIKEAREARKREQQIQETIAQEKAAEQQTRQPQNSQPVAAQPDASKYLPAGGQQATYVQQQAPTDNRGNFKPNPAAQYYNNSQQQQPAQQQVQQPSASSYGTPPAQNNYGAQAAPAYQQPQQNAYAQPQQNTYSQQQPANQPTAAYVKPNPAAQVEDESDKRERRRERRKDKDEPVAQQPIATQPQPQKPKTELDLLKEQFDNVIYAGNDNQQQNYQQPQRQAQPQYNNNQQAQQQAYQQPRQQQYAQQQAYGQQPQYAQQQAYSQHNTQQQYGQQQQYNSQPAYAQQQSYQQQSYGQQQAPQAANQQQQRNDPAKYYTVKRGDTAYTIAKKNGITIRQLMDWNGLDFDAIKEGQNLRVKP